MNVHNHGPEAGRGLACSERLVGSCMVAIDPEDREQVERLTSGYYGMAKVGNVDQMQAALRSLVTPPKPPEPTGLGAVVEDADGSKWIRAARIKHGWHRPMNNWASYDDIAAVRVLSEGVRDV